MGISTRVSLFVTEDRIKSLLSVFSAGPQPTRREITLSELIGHLCPTLDCDVSVEDGSAAPIVVHRNNWYAQDLGMWLRRITIVDRNDRELNDYFDRISPLLRPIVSKEYRFGLAAIALRPIGPGLGAIGGLIAGHSSTHLLGHAGTYAGVLELQPEGPRRSGGNRFATDDQMSAWATEQAKLMHEGKYSEAERYWASTAIAEFAGDPSLIANFPLNRKLTNLESIYELLKSGSHILVPCTREHEQQIIGMIIFKRSPFSLYALPIEHLKLAQNLLEWLYVSGGTNTQYAYRRLPTDDKTVPGSFLDCFSRYATHQGRKLAISPIEDNILAEYTGPPSELEGLKPNMQIRGSALTLSLS
jgi:hypothetical protein